jgi:selenocysteine lyase/cysteine desulfurase
MNDTIEEIREEILQLFGTTSAQHVLIFTSGMF